MSSEEYKVRDMELDVQKRLIVIETQMMAMKNLTGWTKANMIVVLIAVVSFATGYGSLRQEVSELSENKSNNSAALTVLADHGTELAAIRQEHSRLRGNFDYLQAKIDSQTKNRFYSSDGDKLEARILSLEEDRVEHYKETK